MEKVPEYMSDLLTEDQAKSAPVTRSFSHASGSIASMSEAEIINAKGIDPFAHFIKTEVEMAAAGIPVRRVNKLIDTMNAKRTSAQPKFRTGDRIYHKVQKFEGRIERIYNSGMIDVSAEGKRGTIKVKPENLVKL
jgi:hypothetical protein